MTHTFTSGRKTIYITYDSIMQYYRVLLTKLFDTGLEEVEERLIESKVFYKESQALEFAANRLNQLTNTTMNNLKAITKNTDEWLPKCSRTSTFNVITTEDGFKYESHKKDESFFADSQFAEPNKKIAQPAQDRAIDELIDLIAHYSHEKQISQWETVRLQAEKCEMNCREDLKKYIQENYMRINTIYPNSAA